MLNKGTLLHPRNAHKKGYDFAHLVALNPPLAMFVKTSTSGSSTIDFFNPAAVKALNASLLKAYYNVSLWDIPDGYLCPPIPGRADYIHHIADLLNDSSPTRQQKHSDIVGLDVGVGANLIYPILGSQIYGWRMVGSEVDDIALKSAKLILQVNPNLKKAISIRQQKQPERIFDGIMTPQDRFAFTLCNPPFHGTEEEATAGSLRKNKNLHSHQQKRGSKTALNDKKPISNLNFAGKNHELWCEGGELAFIKKMIDESRNYAAQVQWFTSLVSKKDNLDPLYHQLRYVAASEVKTISMGQGNKKSRFIAWRF